MVLLTKSKYLNGLQCPRLLWFSNKKLLPEFTLPDKHKFAQGHEFEEYVKQLYPEAVDLNNLEFKENIDKTKELIKENKTIFEAGFMVDNLFIRADLIKPSKNGWELYEIKSTTQTKPQHIPDLAFQKYVCEKTGLKINKCFIIYLNKEYVKKGKINQEKLTLIEEVTEKVDLIDDIETNAKLFLEIINQETEPGMNISKNCNKPYPCALKDQCWTTLPKNNVLHLTNWRLYWKLLEDGIKDIKDIPEGTKLTVKDQIIKEAVDNNKIIISKEYIKHFLNELNYPLYYFDFETFDTAVPLFDNSKPYQKIPFQYSLHIQSKDNIEHKEFLSDEGDPRLALLEQMKKDLDGKGNIIVYYKSFEISVMKKLAEDFPEHKDWLEQAINRIVDLADPFGTFSYYNPSQKGSYSLKKVLPAITGKKSYSELEINNGGDASMLFFYSHIKKDIDGKNKIRENLLKYCKLDTEGMVWIVDELNKLIK
jgi:CRISPR/Cas system-associated exonuclease Cas4 (RecB family)